MKKCKVQNTATEGVKLWNKCVSKTFFVEVSCSSGNEIIWYWNE